MVNILNCAGNVNIVVVVNYFVLIIISLLTDMLI
jgi:hypothetical protein